MSVLMNGKGTVEPLDFSKHAARRVRQRGLRDRDVRLVIECRTPVAGDGIVLLESDARREIARRKREIQARERLRGCKVVICEGTIVTCYHAHRRQVIHPRHADCPASAPMRQIGHIEQGEVSGSS
jgi:hypothetical protein